MPAIGLTNGPIHNVFEKQDDASKQNAEPKKSNKDFIRWIIIAAVVAFCAGAGFGLGKVLGGAKGTEPPKPTQENNSTTPDLKADTPPKGDEKVWYYDLDPVVANLNEPSVSRYVRASLVLAISSSADQKKTTAFIEKKKPILTNWLNIYLASLSIEDIRGERNLRRIQAQVLDKFNEQLFPDATPRIKEILFKEFAVQ